jgi:CO/xanthine dehydrogenase Mo-binding subunit
MGGWVPNSPGGEGCAKGMGLGGYRNRAKYAAIVVDVEVDTAVHVRKAWSAVDAGLVSLGIAQSIGWTLKDSQIRQQPHYVAKLR